MKERKEMSAVDKYSIIKDDLCIKKILAVIKGNNTNHHKKIVLHGRHSDALVYVSEGSCSYTFDDGVSPRQIPQNAVKERKIRKKCYPC